MTYSTVIGKQLVVVSRRPFMKFHRFSIYKMYMNHKTWMSNYLLQI